MAYGSSVGRLLPGVAGVAGACIAGAAESGRRHIVQQMLRLSGTDPSLPHSLLGVTPDTSLLRLLLGCHTADTISWDLDLQVQGWGVTMEA